VLIKNLGYLARAYITIFNYRLNRIKELILRAVSPNGLYIDFLRKKGATIGEGTMFFGSVEIDMTRPFLIEIGKNCVLTDGVRVLTHGFDWQVLKSLYHEMLSSSGKVVIEDNVFLGRDCIVLKGVRIGKNTIIGAASVVTHDIPSDSVAVGNPCRVKMSISDYYKKRKRKYIEEARLYAFEIYRKTHRIPKIEEFGEEFPLFLKRDAEWGNLPIEMRWRLGNDLAYFLKSKPIYSSFEDFLIDSGIPKSIVKQRQI
jgi:acetyltransferase-like isoleucine patch superfamily enzyme